MTGIVLGPTILGRIPGILQQIFPENSKSYLSLIANIGLCLFLFIIGLEVDWAILKYNARRSISIAICGMVIPFVLGTLLAFPLFHTFIESEFPPRELLGTSQGYLDARMLNFLVFIGVAFSITAFPVLCRILGELKMLDTAVGTVVLSAGIATDIVGWVLLAACVSIAQAGTPYESIWTLLLTLLWAFFMFYPIRKALVVLSVRKDAAKHGCSGSLMTATIFVLFASALVTDMIGIHAIFGAFLAGLIAPTEKSFRQSLIMKMEDVVAIVFLPLYFTLSGLSTDLGLLDSYITWFYIGVIIVLAFAGKFGGCALAARYIGGFSWRDSGTIGALMSCKGLVELIVLNVGLDAGILSQRVFSMFVLEALVLTFLTTPLVTRLHTSQLGIRESPRSD
ncbi:hypothetical protein AX16_006254 [Volvariella volvacea WC 439]|nr:hypothetical protein AX16_006254 [Volvariella volvacea WC 439]